jgi:hypothetical protein
MAVPSDDPVFGHFRCRICGRKTIARKSDSDRYLTLEYVPECCGEHVQLIGSSSPEHTPPGRPQQNQSK